MANKSHVELVLVGGAELESWMKSNRGVPLDLEGWDFGGANLSHRVLRGANLEGANLSLCILDYATFEKASMGGANLDKASIAGVNFSLAAMRNASLRGVRNGSAHFQEADLRGACLVGANLSNSRLSNANLGGAVLHGSLLGDADLRGANLEGADLRGVTVSTRTVMADAIVDGAWVDRYTLESLRDYGGLSRGHRMRMKIVNDAGDIVLEYSGISFWLHAASLVLFCAPYAWFLVLRWSGARYLSGGLVEGDEVSIGLALWRYVVSGGTHWKTSEYHVNWWLVAVFLVMMTYNVLRIMLVRKAKSIEHYEAAVGLPAPFRLSDYVRGWGWIRLRWGHVKGAAFFLFVLSVVALAGHILHFLQMPVPA